MSLNEHIWRARAAIRRRPMAWLAGGVSVSLVIGIAIGLLAGSSDSNALEAERDDLRAQIIQVEGSEEVSKAEEEPEAPAPGARADRLLRQLEPLCREPRAQVWRMAHQAVGELRREAGIETTRVEQLEAAVNAIVATGFQPSDCASVFGTLIREQLATAPKRPTG